MSRIQMAFALLILTAGLAIACGTKSADEVVVNLDCNGSCATLFQDADLVDIVFLLSITSGTNTTTVVYPETCVTSTPQLKEGCGFDKDVAEFRLDPDPLAKDETATLTVRGRDVDGDTIFEGSSSITNSPSANITVTLTPINP